MIYLKRTNIGKYNMRIFVRIGMDKYISSLFFICLVKYLIYDECDFLTKHFVKISCKFVEEIKLSMQQCKRYFVLNHSSQFLYFFLYFSNKKKIKFFRFFFFKRFSYHFICHHSSAEVNRDRNIDMHKFLQLGEISYA